MRFLALHNARRSLKRTVRHARNLFLMREDLLTPVEHARFTGAFDRAREALRSPDPEAPREAEAWLLEVAGDSIPRASFAELRSFFEVWVTALAVAMAFRAYFYQPFRIPTNSMYPTLYGNTSTDGGKEWHDNSPLSKIPKWLLTGSWYKEVVARESGVFAVTAQGPKPGYGVAQKINGSGELYHIPTDAVYRMIAAGVLRQDRNLNNMLVMEARYGQTLWEGRVTLGDFVFVNRWIWNLRPPRRGEVMVFSTTGIKSANHPSVRPLEPGTHYIKRMCGVPGDTLEIRPPNLLVNGEILEKPEMIRLISTRAQLGEWARPFPGYTLPGELAMNNGHIMEPRTAETQLLHWGDKVRLDSKSYYAMGDNSPESSDSRFWGTVPEKNLLGPGAVVYWPFINPRWGRIP